VGWRQIIENMHRTATLSEWHRSKGRHAIYAKGKAVELETTGHGLLLPVIGNSPAGCGGNHTGDPDRSTGSLAEAKTAK